MRAARQCPQTGRQRTRRRLPRYNPPRSKTQPNQVSTTSPNMPARPRRCSRGSTATTTASSAARNSTSAWQASAPLDGVSWRCRSRPSGRLFSMRGSQAEAAPRPWGSGLQSRQAIGMARARVFPHGAHARFSCAHPLRTSPAHILDCPSPAIPRIMALSRGLPWLCRWSKKSAMASTWWLPTSNRSTCSSACCGSTAGKPWTHAPLTSRIALSRQAWLMRTTVCCI